MKILVVGSGGREHALTWKLARDSSRPTLFCAPGNAGTAELATNINVGAEDVEGLLKWARENKPDLTVVGPEVPLCAGLTDRFEAEGLQVFGPSRAAAQIEGSKVFSKEVMEQAGVPTAKSRTFTEAADALAHLRTATIPVVVKAEGLAAGKGVYVCASLPEAEAAVKEIMVNKAFGAAGGRVLIEDFLKGEEASILALTDGQTVLMLAACQDHKRAYNNDQGPNTGGMGAYSPAPVAPDSLFPTIRREVFDRTLAELKRRGIAYKGVLYAGIMLTADGPKVLEFNCRFGDPETQVILPRIDGDLLPALMACATGGLREDMISWKPESCVTVVMASGGYPAAYEKGKPIDGIQEAEQLENVHVFHAGTQQKDGRVVTAGGRVLNVTALGPDLRSAVKKAYLAITRIKYDQAQYRTDIAAKAFRAPGGGK